MHAAAIQSFIPSAITEINGEKAEDYLDEFSTQSVNANDIETRYNVMLYSQAINSLAGAGPGKFPLPAWDGAWTNLTFSNSTKRYIANYATTSRDFTGVNSGVSFFQKFCIGSPSPAAAAPTQIGPTAIGYPYSVTKSNNNAVSGYFLNDTGFQDVAVLCIPTFNVNYPNETFNDGAVEFQSIVRQFFAACRTAEKQKLVIDLRGNPGGDSVLPPDLFAQLFPKQKPFWSINLADNAAFRAIGLAAERYLEKTDLKTKNLTLYNAERQKLVFNDYTNSLDLNGQPFSSFDEMYGPVKLHEAQFTKQLLRNVGDQSATSSREAFELTIQLSQFSDTRSYSYPYFSVSGYLNNTNIAPQPFATENITLVSHSAHPSPSIPFH